MNELVVRSHIHSLPTALARDVARLHTEAIDQGFLTSLGQPFLATLYEGLAASRSSFVITATLDDELLGFICGATDTRRAYLEFALSSSAPRAALRVLPRLWSPSTIRRVVETLRYPSRRTSVELPSAEILNFCVTQSQRGLGIGRRLFEALVAEFSRRAVQEIRIVTGAEQRSAQAFYDRIGAHRVMELEIHEGMKSVAYTYTVREPRSKDA
jgi:ribosomal protein S18 acetylase RimI-like enzyme